MARAREPAEQPTQVGHVLAGRWPLQYTAARDRYRARPP